MAISCPQCSYSNPDSSGFCVKCGNRLQTTGQGNPFSATVNRTATPTFVSSPSSPPAGTPFFPTYPAAPSSPGSTSPSSLQPTYMAPGPLSIPPIDTYSQTGGNYAPPTGGSYPTPGGIEWAPPSTQPPPPPTSQMGIGQGMASIRRAFAGKGSLVMHHSWLLNGPNAFAQSGAVSSAVINTLHQRNIAGLTINTGKLMERGIGMEEREYVTIQRGISTVFLYAAPAGQDLYISRATTALPPISLIRAAINFLLLAFMVIGFTQSPSTQLAGGNVGAGILSIIAYLLSYPILFYFIIMLIRSFIAWLVENDFLVYLRANSLNDFQMDDLALLEQVTDEAIRVSVQQVGLDSSNIVPPMSIQGQQLRRQVRRSFLSL